MNKYESRNIGMDMLRGIALFSVIGVHFFRSAGFYKEIISGPRMAVMVLMRSSFMVCVPLFLMLSGYLLNGKKLSAAYYLRIVRILFIYVVASICCILYRIYIRKEGLSFSVAVLGLLNFSSAPYSWYIEMYIGLFLLIPFLNILYNGLSGRNQRKWLVATLLILTAAPSVFNIFRISGLSWWAVPSSSKEYHKLVPQWWNSIYPITYYFLGCYIKENPLPIKKTTNFILIMLAFCFAGCFNYYRSYNSVFVDGAWATWGSALITVQTVLVFSAFQKMDTQKVPAGIKSMIVKISEWSLGAYLISWVFDDIIYTRLNAAVPIMRKRLAWFILTVPVIFTASVLVSALFSLLYHVTAEKIVRRIQNKLTA